MTRLVDLADWIWKSPSVGAGSIRTLLYIPEILFRLIVGVRNSWYDSRKSESEPGIPVLSVGNLTVGGTGKTPFSAWCVEELVKKGVRPGIVMRGYGDDEWRVHKILNPHVIIKVNPDRVQGVREAIEAGADVCVADDGFQHRRLSRTVDIVLVSADQWDGRTRMLPAGPWREPLSSLRRASLIIVTGKTESRDKVSRVSERLSQTAPNVPIASIQLRPGVLREVKWENESLESGEGMPLESLAGLRVLALSAIANPESFEDSLGGFGAEIDSMRFPDHFSYGASDVNEVLRRSSEIDIVVCTLKDAVKLAPLWPRLSVPLLYVSQTIEVLAGSDALYTALEQVCLARPFQHVESNSTTG